MKRGHYDVDTVLPEMEQDYKKRKLTIPVSTVRKMNNTEVVEMMRNVGLDENTIKCLDQTFTGALVFLTVLFLKDIMKREEEHGWWKEALDEILPSCNNNMKAAEEIICLLVRLYVPREQDLGWVEAKLSKVDRNGTNWVNELYDEAFEYVKSFDSQRPLEPIEEFIEKNFKSDNVKYCSLNLVSHETFAGPLPIKFGTLAKHYLPFIPSLQIESNNDKILERTSCKTVTTIIAPSGTGKTSLMIRRLCKTAGLLLTGTATYEHDSHETTDSTIRTLISCLNSRVNAFGYIRHAVQILLISKLTYLLLLIEKNLLAYLDKKSSSTKANNAENKEDGKSVTVIDSMLDLDWEEDFSTGLLSDDEVNQYLREINKSSMKNANGKSLKNWTDSELMVYLAFNQIPENVVLKLFEKHIGGDYFVTSNVTHEQLAIDCSIDEE
ncbi:predicted protein, partial [Naegleria gruberi]